MIKTSCPHCPEEHGQQQHDAYMAHHLVVCPQGHSYRVPPQSGTGLPIVFFDWTSEHVEDGVAA
jgi:hypothetical protein